MEDGDAVVVERNRVTGAHLIDGHARRRGVEVKLRRADDMDAVGRLAQGPDPRRRGVPVDLLGDPQPQEERAVGHGEVHPLRTVLAQPRDGGVPLALGAVRCAEDCALRETAAAFCEDFGLPFAAVPAEALQADDPRFRAASGGCAAETECEKCAVLGMDGTLLVRRFSQDGAGFALAVLEPSAE